MPLAVSLRSVLERWSRGTLDVYVLEAGVGDVDKAKVAASLPERPACRLHWISVSPDDVRGLSAGLHFSPANYFRLLLPKLLPSLDRVLYLDADTVARADLAPLYALFDEAFPAQACRDYCGTIANPLIHLPSFAEFGLAPDAPYFNTGVLLLNLRAWREEKIAERVLALGREKPETTFFADQTALNLVLHGRIGCLPPEWNAQTVHPKVADGTWGVPYLPQNLDDGKIVHYTSEHKPWGTGKDHPQAALFRDVLSRTAWA
jgi:lipopolysaccharide biosynthesis glycosyltransferase